MTQLSEVPRPSSFREALLQNNALGAVRRVHFGNPDVPPSSVAFGSRAFRDCDVAPFLDRLALEVRSWFEGLSRSVASVGYQIVGKTRSGAATCESATSLPIRFTYESPQLPDHMPRRVDPNQRQLVRWHSDPFHRTYDASGFRSHGSRSREYPARAIRRARRA